MLTLEENIKTLGTFDVPVKIYHNATETVKVWIVAE